MVAKSLTRGLAVLLVSSPAAFALGLGDIRLNSSLNSPLDAEIELIGATPEELANLKAQIATRETFTRYGLDYPSYLSTVSLRSVRTTDGRDVIKLKSTETMTEPFVTLLVEVDWVRGRLVREYTMLLDPPVFTPGQERVANAPIAAPTIDSVREGAIDRSGIDINAAKAALAGAASAAGAAIPNEPPGAIDINAAKAALNSGDMGEPADLDTPPASAPRTGIDINAAKAFFANEAAGQGASSSAGDLSDGDLVAQDSPRPPVAPPAPRAAPSRAAAAGDTYRVEPGDTLSGVASRYTGSSVDATGTKKWMVATFQNNPSAFNGNMNILRSGSVLRIPDDATVSAIGPSEASGEVSRQYSAWSGSTAGGGGSGEPGRLRLVTPNQPASVGTSGDTGQTRALQGRVQELQSQLDESRRLLELRNSELAQLQSRVRQSEGIPAGPESAEAPPEAQLPPESSESQVAANESAEEPAAAPPEEPVRRPTASTEPQTEGGFFDTLKGYWWAIGLLAAIFVAYFGFKSWRSRQDAEFDDSLGRLAAAGADSLSREPRFDTAPAAMPSGRGEAFLVEETGTHERPRLDTAPATAPATRNVAAEDTISSDTAINLDQGDPLAEADFHMAYGLYDQAADLVRIAINREPDRRDLKLKLLEVFFVWGNREQFLQTARELADTRAEAAPGEWEKIVIMGKQLAPDDPLFAGGSASGAGAGGVDLDLEGGQSRVDFDLLGEPLPQEAGGVDLDIGGALGEPEPTMEQPSRGGNRTFALDDGLLGDDEFMGGTTRQMTQNPRMGSDDETELLGDLGSGEERTVEQPAYRSQDPTIRQKVAMAMKQNGRADQTAELALDDLGLDLSALDNDQGSTEAPTLVAGLDERSRRIMETAEYRANNGSGDTSGAPATGSWGFNADEFEDSTSTGRADYANGDGSSTSRLAALKGNGDLDFDVGDLGGETGSAASNGRLDLDIGSDAGFSATQRLSSSDLALPDMEPVTMSEVGTKLDLARAYMDMGDPEGARNILEEVMQEGSVTQKQEAQRLIESLPG